MIRRLSVIGALFAATFAFQSATAAPAAVFVARVPVAYGDLDIGSPAGLTVLKARLDSAARQACGGHPAFLAHYSTAPNFVRASFERCRVNAQQGAIATLQQRGIVIADNR